MAVLSQSESHKGEINWTPSSPVSWTRQHIYIIRKTQIFGIQNRYLEAGLLDCNAHQWQLPQPAELTDHLFAVSDFWYQGVDVPEKQGGHERKQMRGKQHTQPKEKSDSNIILWRISIKRCIYWSCESQLMGIWCKTFKASFSELLNARNSKCNQLNKARRCWMYRNRCCWNPAPALPLPPK